MLGGSSTAAATLSTNTSSATPTSPTRPSRLRGLSYLRNYTHNHLHSHAPTSASAARAEAPGLSRTRSSPARHSPVPAPAESTPSPTASREIVPPRPQRSPTTRSSTTGWVPTVGGQSGLSSNPTQSQAASTEASPAEAAPPTVMTRDRAGTAVERSSAIAPLAETNGASQGENRTLGGDGAAAAATDKKEVMPSIRLIPHHEPRASRPSLVFPIINRTLPDQTTVVRVGRYSERDNHSPDALTNPNSTAPVGFKSKVVSRRHCEFWCANNQWYVRDVKSSSGTFLNHVRLSAPGAESRPYPINDGDIVQLGIDFKGGEEVIFRCVKIRVECNRGWQKAPNPFNTSTHKRLRNLAATGGSKDSDAQSVNTSECSICLNSVAPCQALFVAPCSHVWHYKCIRTLLYPSWPSFQCPNCRAYADLEADVEQPEVEESDDDFQDAIAASQADATQPPAKSTTTPPGSPPRTNGGRAGAQSSAASEEELTAMMGSTDLSKSVAGQSTTSTKTNDTASSANASQPVPIVGSTRTPVNEDGANPRSATPTSTTQFSLAAGIGSVPDGPATPRNDIGPFLLDGASSTRRPREIADLARDPVQEEEEESEGEDQVMADAQSL